MLLNVIILSQIVRNLYSMFTVAGNSVTERKQGVELLASDDDDDVWSLALATPASLPGTGLTGCWLTYW